MGQYRCVVYSAKKVFFLQLDVGEVVKFLRVFFLLCRK